MLAHMLIAASGTITIVGGSAHLALTYVSKAFSPRDPVLEEELKPVPLVISERMLMWRSWVGFNASHSVGTILFGLVYVYLACSHPEVLFHSSFLLALGGIVLTIYLLLASLYWFYLPLAGVAVALVCYICGATIGYAG